MRHHTKDKGDRGLGFVLAALLSKDIQPALPLSEHLPFDCLAISETGQVLKLSVKYRAKKHGVIELSKRSSWADKHGTHVRHHNAKDYDAFAIYCPDTNKCYFIKEDEITTVSFSLRIDPMTGNNNGKKIKWAAEYEDPKRLFI